MKLTARRSMTYNTRRLQAGDSFEANDRMGNLLMKLREKDVAAATERVPAPSPVMPTPIVKPEVKHFIEPSRMQAVADQPPPPTALSQSIVKPEFTQFVTDDGAQIEALRLQAERLGISGVFDD